VTGPTRTLFALVVTLAVAALPTNGQRATLAGDDEAFLEDLSRRSFMFFWEQADPQTGIVRDRSRTDGAPSPNALEIGSIASVGFGLSGMCIATARGWLPPQSDLGITLLSAENLRTGRVWSWFMKNPEIPLALERAGVVTRR